MEDNCIVYPHIGAIPSDWKLVYAGDVCSKITDGTHDTPRSIKEGTPYIKSVHNKNGSIKDFGLGYKNKTVLPIWLITIILAIISYFLVLYYLHLT